MIVPSIDLQGGQTVQLVGGAEKAIDAGDPLPTAAARTAVRYLLEELSVRAPGRHVEVRVPPHGVVQAVEGPRHTRGTPASVVETDAATWVELATGRLGWQQAVAAARVVASGERSDLSGLLPLVRIAPAPGAR